MPVKIRLMRIGANKRPFYRVVAVDERRKRTGGYLELLGTYNPLTQPKEIILKQDRIDDWIKKGAQMSDGFLRIIGKAPQRLPRKPKKEKKEEPQPEAGGPVDQKTEAPASAEETVRNDSEKSEDQNVGKPEKSAEVAAPAEETAQNDSENSEDQNTGEPAKSDEAGNTEAQSPSESSEETSIKEEPKE